MRIATFNVHMWTDRDGRATTEEAIELLRSLDCDAIVLQEIIEDSTIFVRVAEALGMHASFAPASFLGNGLLSVEEPRAFEVLTISSGYAEGRSAFVATLPWEGGAYRLVGTHLDHMQERSRIKQVDKLLAGLGDLSGAGLTVLAGDLNALRLQDYDALSLERIRRERESGEREPPRGDVLDRLEAQGFVDLWRLARSAGPERNAAALRDLAPYQDVGTCWFGTRIDYLLAAPTFATCARLVACDRVPAHASDHLPVVAEIEAVR